MYNTHKGSARAHLGSVLSISPCFYGNEAKRRYSTICCTLVQEALVATTGAAFFFPDVQLAQLNLQHIETCSALISYAKCFSGYIIPQLDIQPSFQLGMRTAGCLPSKMVKASIATLSRGAIMVCIQAHIHRSLGLYIYAQWTSNTAHGLTAPGYSLFLQETIARCIWTNLKIGQDGDQCR